MNKSDGYIKAKAILADAFPNHADRLDSHVSESDTRNAIKTALSESHGKELAAEIAFHMSDWSGDAAFILALHLFPERFTKEEIQQGIDAYLIHVPNHVAEAAHLIGNPVSNIFKE
jgi:hypothetical protein